MATPDILANSSQRLRCGGCNKEYQFPFVLRFSQIPFQLSCPQCKWTMDVTEVSYVYFTIPKHNPARAAAGTWEVKFPGESGEPLPPADDAFSAIQEEIKKLPAELQIKSGPEVMKEMSGLMLTLLRLSEKFRSNIQAVTDNFLTEIEQNRGIMESFAENMEPKLFHDFMMNPFIRLPLGSNDEVANLYGSFLLCPKFYKLEIGIPLGNSDGYTAQVICPYSFLAAPPSPWIQLYLNLPPLVNLRPLKTKIVGDSLPVVWDKIPGTAPDMDHTPSSPSIRMTGDTIAARSYLVRHGCPGWLNVTPGDDFLQVKQDWILESQKKWKKGFHKYSRHGRILFASPERDDRLTFAMCAANCYISKTALIYDSERSDQEQKKARPYDKFMDSITKLDWRKVASHPDLNQIKSIVVEADAPYFPEIVNYLYRYNGRLIVLAADPFFDFWETNTWAPVVYGLCNTAHFYVSRFTKPHAWRRQHKKVSERIKDSLTRLGFVD